VKGRNPTAEEKRHMAKVSSIGCIACLNMGYNTPPEYTLIHHCEGKTKPDAHFKVLPLCDRHHSRYYKTGLHYNKRQWEKEHGTERELMEQVRDILERIG